MPKIKRYLFHTGSMKLTMGSIRNYFSRTTTSNMGLAMLGQSLSDSKKGLRRTRSKICFFPVNGLSTQNSLDDPLNSVSNLTLSEWSGTELGCLHHPQEGVAGRPCFHPEGNFCRCFMENFDTMEERNVHRKQVATFIINDQVRIQIVSMWIR